MAEAGPLQHVADGIADTLNEGRETDGTKADETLSLIHISEPTRH